MSTQTLSTVNAEPSQDKSLPMYVALVPWLLFTVLAEHGTLKLASIAALVIAVVIAVPGIRKGNPKAIEVGAAVAFVGFTVAAFAVDAGTAHWLERYARAIAAALLAAIAFGSLLFVPFTEQYARERVPREYWNTPKFKQVNRTLTLLWAGVFSTMVVSHIIAGTIDHRVTNIVFNWAIPIALVLAAVKRIPEIAGEHAVSDGGRAS
jgi:MFS family permease